MTDVHAWVREELLRIAGRLCDQSNMPMAWAIDFIVDAADNLQQEDEDQ